MKFLVLILGLLLPYVVFPQDKMGDVAEQSNIESRMLTKGKLIKKEFIPLGILQAKYNQANVEVLKLEDLTNSEVLYGVRISFDYATTYTSSTKTAFIDKDEVAEVMVMLKRIQEEFNGPAPTNYTEIFYRCRSGYEIGGYYDKNKKWTSFMKLQRFDNNSSLYMEQNSLLTFQLLLQQAMAKFQ